MNLRRVAWFAFVVLATITFLVLLWQLRSVVILFLLSIAVAAAFRPLLTFFEGRNISRGVALLITYGAFVGLLAGLLYLISRPLLSDLQSATNQFTTFYDTIKSTWPASPGYKAFVAQQLPSLADLMVRFTGGGDEAQSIQTIIGLTNNIFSFTGNLVLILILSIYWSADYLRFERLWLSLLPVEARPQARETYRAIESGLGAYIRSEAIQSLVAGVMLWAGYQLLGLQFAMLLALFGALAWLIPWFGAVIAIIPPLLVGLSQGSLPLAGLAIAYTLLVLFIQEWLIEPRFFTRQNYSSIILVISILILADQFGLMGLVLAPLASATIQIIMRFLLQPPVVANLVQVEVSEVQQEIDVLGEKVLSVREQLTADEEAPAPDLLNLTDRVKKLIEETQKYLGEHAGELEDEAQPDQRDRMPLPGSVNVNR